MTIGETKTISRLLISATPNNGFIGRIEGSNEVKLYWGEEFEKDMAELSETERAQVVVNPSERQEEGPPRKDVTPEDIAEFAAKYQPTQMSQKEYDSFLEDLVDKGILQEREIGSLGYHGCITVGAITAESLRHGSVSCYTWDTDTRNGVIPRVALYGNTLGLANTYGNALALARIMSSWKPASSTSTTQFAFAKKSCNAYTIMADVLEAMQCQRANSLK